MGLTQKQFQHSDYKIITKTLRGELEWLWDQRNSIHLDKITDPHIDLYTVRDVNKARRIVRKLSNSLNKWHTDKL